MLEHIDIPQQDLYDGLETGLYERTFRLPLGDISFTVDDLGRFDDLRGRIGHAAFGQVIADAGIQRRHDTFRGAYDLPLEFLERDAHLIVFASGELSAGRFQLTLQGAWRRD